MPWGSAAICRCWSTPRARRRRRRFFGHRLESHQKEVTPFWTPEGNTNCAGSVDAMQKAVDYVRKSGVKAKRIGVEMAFLPADAARTLRGGLAGQRGEGRAVRAGAAARQEAPRRACPAAQGLRAGRRVHEGRDRQDRPRHDQAGAVRDAAARGGQPRAHVRVSAADRRHQPQPRPVGLQVCQGRHHVARLRRQLPRLYRRPLPHGHHRRAGCASSRTCSARSR